MTLAIEVIEKRISSLEEQARLLRTRMSKNYIPESDGEENILHDCEEKLSYLYEIQRLNSLLPENHKSETKRSRLTDKILELSAPKIYQDHDIDETSFNLGVSSSAQLVSILTNPAFSLPSEMDTQDEWILVPKIATPQMKQAVMQVFLNSALIYSDDIDATITIESVTPGEAWSSFISNAPSPENIDYSSILGRIVSTTQDCDQDDKTHALLLDTAKFFIQKNNDISYLRNIIHSCAKALDNGAYISKDASLEFMAILPSEISLFIKTLKLQAAKNEAS